MERGGKRERKEEGEKRKIVLGAEALHHSVHYVAVPFIYLSTSSNGKGKRRREKEGRGKCRFLALSAVKRTKI